MIAAIVGAVATAIGSGTALSVGRALNTSRLAEPAGVPWSAAIALLVLAFIAFLVGGYVSGTMARAWGVLVGLSAWLWGAAAAVVASLIVVLAGSAYAVLYQFDLFPRLQVGSLGGSATAIVSAIVIAAGGLLGAVIGGSIGSVTHRKVRVEA